MKNSAFGGTLAFSQHRTIRDSGAGYSPIWLDRAQIDAGNLARVSTMLPPLFVLINNPGNIRRPRGARRLARVSNAIPPSRLTFQDIPKSTAQIPVPVPRSRTRFKGLSFPAGQTYSRLSCMRTHMWCWRSGRQLGLGIRRQNSNVLPRRSFSRYTFLSAGETVVLCINEYHTSSLGIKYAASRKRS